ncbi:MAG: NRDE family protein [Ignavibacteriaceae bacterium]
MCLLLISYKNHPRYKLIVAANRDEFYNRPASPAHFWEDKPELLAGIDFEAGGTWLGLTTAGNFSAITNYRDIKNLKKDAPTRGKLVTDFLLNNFSPVDYIKVLEEKSGLYNGYNLIFGNLMQMNYFSNQTKKSIELAPGIYGLSNHLLDTPWYKVEKSKKSFSIILMKQDIDNLDLFEILSDKSYPADDMLPDTGVGLKIEKAVSPVFVETPYYGTRSSTVILIDKDDHVIFSENSLNTVSGKWIKSSFEFEISG